jgi:hypothetical protein
MKKLLVVVHPGSACGSASDWLGWDRADTARERLAQDIREWNGSVLVIDNLLSDELWKYPALDTAINRALERATANGEVAVRLHGDDGPGEGEPDQVDVAREFIEQQRLNPAEWEIELTGAWMGKDSGCVRGVWEALRQDGLRADVRDSAVWGD